MTELLGGVASGIAVAQLAGAIVGSTQKIYSFYSQMKDAPKKLGDSLVEIELLGEVLVDFYDQNAQITGQSKVVPKVLKHCRTVMENLDKILNVLEDCLKKDGGMIKRQWRTLKVVLKEKTLEELTERLERAKSLLTLAVNCHSMHLNKAMQQTLIQLSTSGISKYNTTQTNKAVAIPENNSVQVSKKESTSIISGTAHSYGFFSYWSTTSVFNQQKKKKHLTTSTTGIVDSDEDADVDIDLTILPKAWMRLKGMHIKQSRRFGRWTYYFRPIRVVPDDSPIFSVCKNGDIGEILQLVQTGRASVFDTSQQGYNLIHFAALHLRADLCRWLLAQGVQATETGVDQGETALHLASYFLDCDYIDDPLYYFMKLHCVENRGRHNDALNTIRALIEVGQCDPMQESKFGNTSLHLCAGDGEPLNYMFNQESVLINLALEDDIVAIFEYQMDFHIDSHIVDTRCLNIIIKFMMEKSIQFSESRRLKDGFPSWPDSLHSTLELLSDVICNPGATCDPTPTISLIFALLEMEVDIHREDQNSETPLSRLFGLQFVKFMPMSTKMNKIPSVVFTWFSLLRRAGYDLQDYIIQESNHRDSYVIFPFTPGSYVWYIHIFQACNSADIIYNCEWYDCRDQETSFRLSNSLQKPRMPGAWEDDTDLKDYPEFKSGDIRRPSRSPDFEMSFVIGPLIDGEQNFDHISSIQRRKLACSCFWFRDCPHEPQFGRYDIETGKLDLCSCLEENGCKCKDEDTTDDGSELGSEAESIYSSKEDEERSDDDSELEDENESISSSNEHEAPKEPNEDDALEGESESACRTEYYCLNCDRKYSGPISAD